MVTIVVVLVVALAAAAAAHFDLALSEETILVE